MIPSENEKGRVQSDRAVFELSKIWNEQEYAWRKFLSRHFPGAVTVKWSPNSRVYRYGERALKIQSPWFTRDQPLQTLGNQFRLLSAVEGLAWHLNPTLQEVDEGWQVLGMDWIEGENLDDLIHQGRAGSMALHQLLQTLFAVSRAGVLYKQLRPRHIIRGLDGKVFFIDFGGSSLGNPRVAFLQNFRLLAGKRLRVNLTSLGQILKAVLVGRVSWCKSDLALPTNGGYLQGHLQWKARRVWEANLRRMDGMLSDYLRQVPGDDKAAHHFAYMEKALADALDIDTRLFEEMWKMQIAGYLLYGCRNWGVVWDHILRRVTFDGKRVVDLGCGAWPVGAFARLEGATQVILCDSLSPLLRAACHFAEGFGFTDNMYQSIHWETIGEGQQELPVADVALAMSVRFDKMRLDRILDTLAKYNEVLWETRLGQDALDGLRSRGYYTVETLTSSYGNRCILYAARPARK